MTTQKAIITTTPKHAGFVLNRSLPALRDDSILVKNVSVALNPTDWKHIEFLAPPGVLVGCDYAGIVQEVGKDVKKPFKKGDRICGFVHGSNASRPEDGAFAEYVMVKGDLQIKIPDTLSFQEAASLGLGVTTASQGLYQSLGLALPDNPIRAPVPILVYGGSTATGTLAIQFAKLSAYEVLTTCSPRNFSLAKKLGADAVFDYNDPTSATAIRKYTQNGLKLVFDTVSTEASATFCDQALSTEGGDYSALLPISIERDNVNARATMAYTAFGEAFRFGPRDIPGKPDDRVFSEKMISIIEKLLQEGKFQAHPIKVCGGGLKGVLEGLELLKNGKVSGEKLVYNITDSA